MVDFLVEIQSFTIEPEQLLHSEEEFQAWVLSTDGASNSTSTGIGVVLKAPSRLKIEEAGRLNFQATNNEVEYEALIYGMGLAKHLGVKLLKVKSDLKLIVEQVARRFEAKEPRMKVYFDKALALSCQFQSFIIEQVPQELNQRADELAKGAALGEYDRRIEIVSVAEHDVFSAEQICSINNEPPSWMDLIIMYLQHEELPKNKNKARNLWIRAARYALIGNHLYCKSFIGPYMRCLSPEDARRLLEEIHEGICRNHSGGRSLAHKALTAGYYWPYMMTKAREYVKRCDKCQRFALLKHQPAEHLNFVVSSWPFTKWGLDIIGELPLSPGGKCYVLMATDYFTKWVTAEAYTTVNQSDTISFVSKYLICQFGVRRELVAANGT